MTGFIITFVVLVVITLLLQLITKMKIVGADELAIVAESSRSRLLPRSVSPSPRPAKDCAMPSAASCI